MKYRGYCTLSNIIRAARHLRFDALKMGSAASILSYAQTWRLRVMTITLRRDRHC
jgi:hypothetical protein